MLTGFDIDSTAEERESIPVSQKARGTELAWEHKLQVARPRLASLIRSRLLPTCCHPTARPLPQKVAHPHPMLSPLLPTPSVW